MEKHNCSFQVNSEKISHDTPRPKVGPTVDLRMSDADMNDLRFEALTSRINVTVSPPKKRKVETTTETLVRSRPTPAVGYAESYIQTEDPNDDTVPVLADEDFNDQEKQNISYETKGYTQHIFDPEPNLKREFTPHMKQSKNLSADTWPPLSPVMEKTLYRRSVAFLLLRILWFQR